MFAGASERFEIKMYQNNVSTCTLRELHNAVDHEAIKIVLNETAQHVDNSSPALFLAGRVH